MPELASLEKQLVPSSPLPPVLSVFQWDNMTSSKRPVYSFWFIVWKVAAGLHENSDSFTYILYNFAGTT